ncbi:hypothetical protein GCM10023238_29140 [Streptomyces heliomycini]
MLITNLASVAIGFAMFSMSLVIPQMLQLPEETGYGPGQSLLTAGLVMAPSGLVMMALGPGVRAGLPRQGPEGDADDRRPDRGRRLRPERPADERGLALRAGVLRHRRRASASATARCPR